MKHDPADDRELAERIVSHLPYCRCGATVELLMKDVGCTDKPWFRKVLDEIGRLTGVLVCEGRLHHQKQYWINGPTNQAAADKVTERVLKREDRAVAA